MSEAILAALFLNFAGAVGAVTMRSLPTRSWVTYKLFAPVAYGGAIATFLAMFLFIKDQGLLDGIVYFFASGYAFVLLGSLLIDGFRSILGLGALGIGGYLAVHVLL
jgi:hypothetical protein